MRGVISFLILLAFLFPLLQLAALENRAQRAAAAAGEDALFLQKKNALELDVKNALRQALWSARGAEREALARDATLKLAALEPMVEEYCARRGATADLWFGVASESEITAMLEKTRSQRAPVKCSECFDFAAPALDSRGNPALLTAALLDADALSKKIRISRNGLASLPLAAPFFAKSGTAGFGATLYFPERNASSVIMLSEGFEVETS
ncbi:MAG: hypothetical protein V1817_04950 [Candidatus Micrarchaeota archaeon]